MKVMVIEIKHCHLKNKIRPYLKDIIKNHKISDTWKIQLRIASNFISSTDNNEKHVMHSKIDSIEIIINDEENKNRYQNNLESMKGSQFLFNYVHLFH